MIRSYFQKRRARKIFERLVTPEAAAAIARGEGLQRQPFTAAQIEFVFVLVRGDTPEVISERVGKVAGIAISHKAVVHDLVCELAVIAFGTHPAISSSVGQRAALVEQLGKELSGHVKIIHGAAAGHYGQIGSEYRMAYGFLLPHFNAVLGRLSSLEFGQIEEFVR